MEALRNLQQAIYDLIDLRSVRDVAPEGEYDEVGPPRPLADPFVQQGLAAEAAIEAQYGHLEQGRDQG